MRYLLDTHSLIWFLEGDNRLSVTAKDIFNDDNADIYLSIVSLWEMAIKISLGKLKLSQSLEQVIDTLEQQSISLLSVKPAHVLAVLNLPFEHRDPFDRLLIGQSLVENMKFLSNEALFLRYGVDRVW
ncbi:type II toxin-antitoxin system VapC family toxin [Candidatus Methylobacter oryzae]|uniref:Type II toxin-antitoxin system VapC family toxin n=1 Tax=Candidatus Methylobacter oryzae TaxID=2497749 RepID=A0ABY3C5X4_9GAMM|nr:type II toxin-antitoxin system VapC family toxin [Candidatus Methylobacter oryzae]TRW90242.1 type II toxin-antitoxin system VapC family toxin [Candidatus Methylobacter oryzae]